MFNPFIIAIGQDWTLNFSSWDEKLSLLFLGEMN